MEVHPERDSTVTTQTGIYKVGKDEGYECGVIIDDDEETCDQPAVLAKVYKVDDDTGEVSFLAVCKQHRSALGSTNLEIIED